MIEEDFYATIKLKNGEEIYAKVAASEEEDKTVLLLSNPITVEELKGRDGNIRGYKFEPWLKTTTEDLIIINIDDILTMVESNDIEMISTYQSYVREFNSFKGKECKIDRKMGYIANINDAKDILEKLYKRS